MKATFSFRLLVNVAVGVLLLATHAQAVPFKIDPRMSYLWTTENDDEQLSVEVNPLHPVVDNRSPYGFDLVAAGIPVGSYVRLYTTGDVNFGDGNPNAPFALGGVFTVDNAGLGGSSSANDRFRMGVNTRVPVPSLGANPLYTPPFVRSQNLEERRDIPDDFRIDPLLGIIVKVPARYLRHTVVDDTPRDHVAGAAQSSIYFGDNRDGDEDAYLQVDVVPISQLPRFYFEADGGVVNGSFAVSEVAGGRNIRIRRDQGTQYACKVRLLTKESGADYSIYAKAGTDFTVVNQVVTFAANEIFKDIWLPVVNDTTYEPSAQSFLARIEVIPNDNPNEAFVHDAIHSGGREAVVSITSDDAKPRIRFDSGSHGGRTLTDSGTTVTQSVNEPAPNSNTVTVVVPVRIDIPTDVPITAGIHHDIDGSNGSNASQSAHAGNGNDFGWPAAAPTSVTFPAGGSLTASLQLNMYDDDVYEGAEKIFLRLSTAGGVSNPTLEGTSFHQVSIVDNDPVPNLWFTVGSSSPAEPSPGNTSVHNVGLSLDRPSKFPVRVWYARSSGSTATSGPAGFPDVDVNFSYAEGQSNHLTIAPMQRSWSIPITLRGDGIYEGTEALKIELGAVATEAAHDRNRADGLGFHTMTINDLGEVPPVTVTFPSSLTQPEVSAVWSFTVSRTAFSAFPTSVAISFDGTATAVNDYSWSIPGQTRPATITLPASSSGAVSTLVTVQAVNDTNLEFDETIRITVGQPLTNGLSGKLNGNTATASSTLVIDDDDGGSFSDSAAMAPKPLNVGRIAVTLAGIPFPSGNTPVALWRIVGEPSWRLTDDPATTETVEGRFAGLMCPGYHQIEFRPLDGYESPGRQVIQVTDANTVFVPATYHDIGAGSPGSLTVNLGPTDASLPTVPEAGRLQWRLEGESAWRNSGTTVSGLPDGSHKVVFKKVTGKTVPIPRIIKILPGAPATFTHSYLAEAAILPKSPQVLAPETTDLAPYSFCGRISSSAGYGTGTAIRNRVVLTAAHVLFDDEGLTFATDVRWHHQAHRGHYQPGAASASEYTGVENAAGVLGHSSKLIPRGWVMTSGYAAQREVDQFGDYSAGIGSPASQNMDIAAAFFTDSVVLGDPVNAVVARGGHVGMRYRDPASGHAVGQGYWFNGTQKLLVGYPVEGYSDDDRGKMHGSDPAGTTGLVFQHSHGNVFTSSGLVGSGGVSGGPLLIRANDADEWRQAGIFLGGVGQGIYYELHEELFRKKSSLLPDGPANYDGVITLAEMRSNAGDNGTGDGSTTVTQGSTDSSNDTSAALAAYSLGYVRFTSNHPAGRWAKKPARVSQTPQYLDPATLLDLPTATSQSVVFKPISGWITPQEATVLAPAIPGNVSSFAIHYIPTNYASLQSLLAAALPSAEPAQLGPFGDLDQDGVKNLLEWAFNLDPLNSDSLVMVPTTGVSGLPVATLVGGENFRRLKIEYVKLRNVALTYTVEFSSNCVEGTWTSGGNLIATTPIDPNWERVVVEDSQVSLPVRFVRVRVSETP